MLEDLNTGRLVAGSGGGGGGKGGGKGGGGKKPKEAKDNLFSNAIAEVLFAIAEGEIELFRGYDGHQRVYFDNTPVLSAAGQYNFEDTEIAWTTGTPSQQVPLSLTKAKTEYPVGVYVKQGVPVTRTLNDPDCNTVILRVRVPSLMKGDKKGNVKEDEVAFNFQIATNGQPFATVLDTKIRGKTNSPYEKSYVVSLPSSTSGRWDIRCNRITPDSSTVQQQNELVWVAYTSVEKNPNNYAGVSLLGVRLPSEQFSSIPSISIEGWGRRVLIPHNYDNSRYSYNGTFNGSLVPGWSDNPAWILWDILTDTDAGAGIPSSQLDVWSFYAAAQYNDGTVPDGKGGRQRRYTFNAYLTEAREAFDMINAVASSMRANVWWDGSKVVLSQDRPQNPVRMYSPANVIFEYDDQGRMTGGGFEYSCTDATTRSTSVTVRYINPETWEPDVEVVLASSEEIARYGYRNTDIDAIGCTSQGLAHRIGRWELYTSLYQTEILTFKVASEGLLVSPNEVIQIADPMRAGKSMAGRITSATSTTIGLDRSFTVEAGVNHVIYTLDANSKVVTTQIANSPGTYTTLTVSAPFSFTPLVGSPWMIASSTVIPQQFQVLKVTELEGDTYQIEAASYSPYKFGYVEQNRSLPKRPISSLPKPTDPVPAPTNLSVIEELVETKAGVVPRVTFFWNMPDAQAGFIDRYQVEFKESSDLNWAIAGLTANVDYVWDDFSVGDYSFRVQAINKLGKTSVFSSTNASIVGLTAPPVAVSGQSLTSLTDNQAILSWARSSDLDVRVGGSVVVKHTVNTNNPLWNSALTVAIVSGSSTSVIVPLIAGVYMVKFQDSGGRESVNASFVRTTGLSIVSQNVVQVVTADPLFAGIATDTFVSSGKLQLATQNLFEQQSGLFDSVSGNFDDYVGGGDVLMTTGYLELSQTVNLGRIAQSRLSIDFNSYNESRLSSFDDAGGLFDDRTGLIDGGTDASDASATVQVSLSMDGATYGEWRDLVVGEYNAWAYKFRVVLRSIATNVGAVVDRLRVTVDMPDRMQTGIVTTSATLATNVLFGSAYQVAPAGIDLTIQNAAAGDYWQISNITTTGFSIRCYASGGTQVARNVSYVVESY